MRRSTVSLIIGGGIALFLIIAISLFNFKLVPYIPKEVKTEGVKQLILWINNLLGISFFIDVAYFSIDFMKKIKEEKE